VNIQVHCPSCNKAHAFSDLVPFRAECEACSADLHVCLSCRFYDRYVENQCREDQADPVATKDRRNLCEYWKPVAIGAVDDAAAAAKAKLAALFGGAPASPSSSTPSSSTPSTPSTPSPQDEAKRKLEALFKKPG
jgi:hypothetical protein